MLYNCITSKVEVHACFGLLLLLDQWMPVFCCTGSVWPSHQRSVQSSSFGSSHSDGCWGSTEDWHHAVRTDQVTDFSKAQVELCGNLAGVYFSLRTFNLQHDLCPLFLWQCRKGHSSVFWSSWSGQSWVIDSIFFVMYFTCFCAVENFRITIMFLIHIFFSPMLPNIAGSLGCMLLLQVHNKKISPKHFSTRFIK